MKEKILNATPLLAIIAMIIIVLHLLDVFKPQPEKRVYKAKQLKVFVESSKQKSTRLFAYSQGEVIPKQQFDLKSRVEGQITYIAENFVQGGFIKKGQVLVKLEEKDYRLNVTQREATVAQAKQNLSKVEAQARIAQAELDELGRTNASDLAKWIPQMENAKAMVKSAQAQLDRAMLDLERTTIRSPFDGVVRKESVSIGQYVSRNGNLATLYANDVMEVSLALSGKQLNLTELPLSFNAPGYEAGIPVELTADMGAEELMWQGRIVRTNGAFDSRTRTLNVIAEIRNQGDQQPILPGLFVNAKISGRMVEGATTLARTALRKNDEIWFVDDDNKLQIKPVNLVFRDNEKVIVTGLKEKTRVVTSALAIPTPGMSVRVLLKKPATRLAKEDKSPKSKKKKPDKHKSPQSIESGGA